MSVLQDYSLPGFAYYIVVWLDTNSKCTGFRYPDPGKTTPEELL